jgi:DNA-binding transcriptional ArsR family regulator
MGKNGALDPRGVAAASQAMPDAAGEQRIEQKLESICSPVRVKILRALAQSDLAAGDLALVIGRSASATSQHLRVLRDAGVVRAARTGNIVRYKLAEGFSPEMIASFAMQLDAA